VGEAPIEDKKDRLKKDYGELDREEIQEQLKEY